MMISHMIILWSRSLGQGLRLEQVLRLHLGQRLGQSTLSRGTRHALLDQHHYNIQRLTKASSGPAPT